MNEVAQSIFSTLGAGTALVSLLGGTAIYQQQAPNGTPLPYVVFNKQAGGPEYVDPHDRRDLVYYVRAYAESAKAAGAIDGACENLLHRQSIVVTGWNTVQCYRTTDLESVDNRPDGEPVFMAGGFYRVRIV